MKNNNKKLICLLMALVFVLGTTCTISVSAEEKTVPKRTIMLYAIGSNLEADSQCFTKKVIEFSNSPYNENLDIIVITGGSFKWNTPAEYLDGTDEIDVEYDQVWKVVGKKDGEEHGSFKLIEPTGMPGYEKANMGMSETLTAFIDYCYENYPADIYDIILWDHGGGPVGGYGKDDRFNTVISLSHLVSAFADSNLIKEGKKFNLIDFDACLMSNVTVITALGAFADYFVVSPEVEYDPAQRHLRLLETLFNNPSISGYEMGKILVDDFAEYFTPQKNAATLSLIDVKNFKERMLPLVRELDEIFISEATKTGDYNDRYNFYDEMYSLLYSYVFAQDTYSLYDLGNLVGALSVPMSEMDNISTEERIELENAYTDIAKRILAVLLDCDGSGDDVLYFRCSDCTYRTVGAGVVRGANGELVYAENYDKPVVAPTGLSILFADKNMKMSTYFVKMIKELLDDNYTEEEIEFFKARMTSVAYYGLIYNLGSNVSILNSKGAKNISYTDVKKVIIDSGNWNTYFAPLIEWLVEVGEFADADEVEDYLTNVVAQQTFEVVSNDKVTVRPIKSSDGDFDSYLVTVNNSSAQVLMNVESVSNVTFAGSDTPVYLGFFEHVYGNHSLDELYPNGMSINLVSGSGELNLAMYYQSVNDTLADLYERIYSSSTSVWTLPKMMEECLVVYDLDGGAHIVDLHYLDESHEHAYMPLSIYDAENGMYRYSKLILRCENSEWSILGVSNSDNDLLSFVVAPSNAGFDNYLIAPGAYLTDSIYDFTATVPISSYFPIDATKDNWGLSFGYELLSELDDVADFSANYYLADVYGVKVNINSAFEAADEAAKRDDYVRDISVTDITVTDTIFTGLEASPDVKVVYEGRTLENGVDYKVICDGSSNPGNAYLVIFGIGDFCGTIDLTYTIKDSLAVKVDGKEISEDYYIVDEDTGAVTLTDEYVKTLSVGNHTLTVIISGAETTTNFTIDSVGYKVTESNGTEWTKDSGKALSFRTDADIGKFSAVRIDGKEVAAENYAVGGDGIVTLKDSFLKTLTDGEHALTIVFTDGEASATFTVLAANTQPQTGNDSHILLWIIILIVGVTAVVVISLLLIHRRKKALKK